MMLVLICLRSNARTNSRSRQVQAKLAEKNHSSGQLFSFEATGLCSGKLSDFNNVLTPVSLTQGAKNKEEFMGKLGSSLERGGGAIH